MSCIPAASMQKKALIGLLLLLTFMTLGANHDKSHGAMYFLQHHSINVLSTNLYARSPCAYDAHVPAVMLACHAGGMSANEQAELGAEQRRRCQGPPQVCTTCKIEHVCCEWHSMHQVKAASSNQNCSSTTPCLAQQSAPPTWQHAQVRQQW